VSAYNNPVNDYYEIAEYGEYYCSSSRCLNAVDPSGVKGPSCHNMTCVQGVLMVKIQYAWYACEVAGQVINVTQGSSYTCPTPANKFCNEVPSYASWPTFTSVSPSRGRVGSSITLQASGFGTANISLIRLGDTHGCSEPTVNVTKNSDGSVTITCKIGELSTAGLIISATTVDVIISDNIGRTALGVKSFTLSKSSSLVVSYVLLVVAVVMVLLTVNV